jgi:hypothetical protein
LRKRLDDDRPVSRNVSGLVIVVALTLFSFVVPLGAHAAGKVPTVDWEQTRSTPRTDTGDYSPFVNQRFTSTKSLPATTAWLKWAMERYGGIAEDSSGDPNSALRLSNVRFAGCTMQWVERRTIEKGRVIQDDDYSLALRDVSEESGALMVDGHTLTVSLNTAGTPNPLHYIEKIQHREDGAVTSNSQVPRTDSSFALPLQNKDDIARRIGTALIHAARLCRSANVR